MRRWFAVVTLAVLVIGLAEVRAEPSKPTVAVLYFDYAGKDDDLAVLRKGLAQMMISDLSGLSAIQLVERARLENVLGELKLGQAHQIDAATAARAGKLLGARYLVLGGYFDLKAKLRIDARVVEVETGKVVQAVGAAGDADDVLALEQKLVTAIAGVLSTQLAVPAAKAQLAPKLAPPSRLPRRTAVLYARALHNVDSGNKARAKEQLQQVVKDQPDFKLAMADLDKLLQ